MTRVCSCGRYLGTKCPECGSPVLRVGIDFGEIIFTCSSDHCCHRFKPGEGKISTGLCEECKISLKEGIVGPNEIRA